MLMLDVTFLPLTHSRNAPRLPANCDFVDGRRECQRRPHPIAALLGPAVVEGTYVGALVALPHVRVVELAWLCGERLASRPSLEQLDNLVDESVAATVCDQLDSPHRWWRHDEAVSAASHGRVLALVTAERAAPSLSQGLYGLALTNTLCDSTDTDLPSHTVGTVDAHSAVAVCPQRLARHRRHSLGLGNAPV
jgi:hypothetical protein